MVDPVLAYWKSNRSVNYVRETNVSCIAKGIDTFSANQFDRSVQEVAIPGNFQRLRMQGGPPTYQL